MKNISLLVIEDDATTYDDIDELFSQLAQYEPPVNFVSGVMDKIASLPRPQMVFRPATRADEYHELVVYRSDAPAS